MIGLLHTCETPLSLPATEDQRVWTCPDCSRQWRWDVIDADQGAIGWVRGEKAKVAQEPEPVLDVVPVIRGWQYADDFLPHHDGVPLPGWSTPARPEETRPWYWWLAKKKRQFLHWYRLQWW